MKKITAISVFFILFLSAHALAETSIKAEVDKLKISTDDLITYKLTIASVESKIPKPEFPDFAGFIAFSHAQSSTMSFSKNQVKTILVYVVALAAKEKGKFKIGPSSLKLLDETLTTESFEIEVTQGSGKPRQLPGKKPFKKPAMPIQPPASQKEPQTLL